MDRLISAFFIYIMIFLFGMTVMKIGFRAMGDEKIRTIIQKSTSSPLKGLLIGTLLTAILQSSSAVTVITVGLAAAGLIRFSNTIGVIIGANIGTTFTGLLATFSLGRIHIVLILIGFLLLFTRKSAIFCLGTFLIGLGCLFLSMDGFNTLSIPLRELAPVKYILTAANHSLWMALTSGALFTAIIQSSSATTMIAMGFLNNGFLTLLASITIVIGANVGTCVTAILASIGSNWQARWVSYTHLVFNIGGALLALPFLKLSAGWLESLHLAPDTALAYSGILFNAVSALLFLPFIDKYGRWVEKRAKGAR
ncbi:Na/Pi symporter [Pullulanibacillus sp. KACC 23026]|uniref:Na/Pi symporter n=1 Tax=Pullulanibacillus sp. KACC 23026 TaxID=3028315 RepID=UPI0023B00FFF|nr:Na/Pi symporter [Pullulanibacillus sp. KACC 23026]WEG14227.1 Na/Pi symporter [Pullulanibacillus sp. KACC 23026]